MGYKLGYTSAAMRAQMKVATPNYGHLFAHMRVCDDGLLPFDDLIHPLVEPEFALVVGRDLTSPPYTRETIFSAACASLLRSCMLLAATFCRSSML